MIPVRSLLLTAPESGAGKTTITLGLLRMLKSRGVSVAGAKSGPDYIDPMYHETASEHASVNLDVWAMPPDMVCRLAREEKPDLAFRIIESAMGVLDGAGLQGGGNSSDLAELINAPIIVIVNAKQSAHSAVLPVLGLRAAKPNLKIIGMIANQVSSPSHAKRIRVAADKYGVCFLGSIPRNPKLALPSRHLGLLLAREHKEIDKFLDEAAISVEQHLDIDTILEGAAPLPEANSPYDPRGPVLPIGQQIAIAQDDAFCFIYPHWLSSWKANGAELHFFSPLKDETPPPHCDAVFLPGGYPELHASKIASAHRFKQSLQECADKRVIIYGECGGYMVLGRGLEDKNGRRYEMLGLLGHTTSFRNPKIHLGYRYLTSHHKTPFKGKFAGHEFHYASMFEPGEEPFLFESEDADGNRLGEIGGYRGSVCGSFAHVICASP